ncbi:MAG TPA: ABC transporter permease [Rhizomicrobium sp.]|nr:ABC transporter permease [Rhizomicrobium sp.]
MTDLSQWAQTGLRTRRSRPPLQFPKVQLRRAVPLLGLVVPLALLLAWYGVTAAHWVPEQILPAPVTVLEAFAVLLRSGDLQHNLAVSLSRVAYGFGAGTLAGLLFGAGMGFSDGFSRLVRPTFLIIAQIPILAWLPFFMLLLGIGEALKVVLVAKAVFTPITLATSAGIRGVPQRYLELARILQFTRWQTLARVIFPATLPQLFSGLRYGLTHAWLALVAVELLASYEGIGYLMVYSRQLFQLDVMVAIMLVIGAVGLVFDRLLALGEAWLQRRYGGAS